MIYRVSIRTTAIAAIALCLYTMFLMWLCGSLSFSSPSSIDGISVLTSSEFLSQCNGYPMDYRINEQKRILDSVRLELIDYSQKLESVSASMDEIAAKIPEKQAELALVEEQIANARRSLEELRARRNVRVFLPHAPFRPPGNPRLISIIDAKPSFDYFGDLFDYSRCSISSFLPVYLYPQKAPSPLLHSLFEEFKTYANVVNEPRNACLSIHFSNGVSGLNLSQSSSENHLIINTGRFIDEKSAIVLQAGAVLPHHINVNLNLPQYNSQWWMSMPSLLPYTRKTFLLMFIEDPSRFRSSSLKSDFGRMVQSAAVSSDNVKFVDCSNTSSCMTDVERGTLFRSSMFCVLTSSDYFSRDFWESLKEGCIPVILSTSQKLPFDDVVDWKLASIRIPSARLPELHFILRSIEMPEVLEMKRCGRLFFDSYLRDTRAVVRTTLSWIGSRIGVPLKEKVIVKAKPLFDGSFESPLLSAVNPPLFEEEYLGPLEASVDSPMFLQNFTTMNLYSKTLWSSGLASSFITPESLPFAVDAPSEAEFYDDSNIGFRPISPGSGAEFSRSLGGNRVAEQFTVVLLTYNRDAVLQSAIERLNRLPYLNKVIVVWNNVGREPLGSWPKLHVPVEFIKVDQNSLNNRFIPWDRITTEAVLSLDDDIDLKQHEIVFAFRVWRENRQKLVGFPARHHARYGDSMFYNSNHTCQLSIILTGAAFIHKFYLHAYWNVMPEAIRDHIDKVMNCEDIAMNFLISHLTRAPPIKTTSRWTLRCPTCSEALWQDESHFSERHECIRLFSRIYGYNPLKFSQFRADSILFKTRLPADKQKCFKYV